MIYKEFEIIAFPKIIRASCKTCGNEMIEIPDGWFASALYCTSCNDIYTLRLLRVDKKKIDKHLLKEIQARYGKKDEKRHR
jgi:hypothetical protein